MRLLLTTEEHFSRDAAGNVYCRGPSAYAFWSRYLSEFEQVRVLTRVASQSESTAGEQRSDGPGVSFHALPDYSGPWEFLRILPRLSTAVRQAVRNADAHILRVPGLIGQLAWREIKAIGKPYAIEVLGDPWDVLGPGAWPSVFRPLFRRAAKRELKRLCKTASAVSYVTQHALQQRYPPGANAYASACSDALMNSVFASPRQLNERIRRIERMDVNNGRTFRVGFVGSLARLYKGPDVLLRATALCCAQGLNMTTSIVGSGRHFEDLEQIARQLGIAAQIEFHGQLRHGQPILDFLDSIDLFVLPSRQEGLPRALLEAMARGCPCIGSNVGGIPELLDWEDLVPSANAKELATAIVRASKNPEQLKARSLRNYERAKRFSPEALAQAQRSFLKAVKARSQSNDFRITTCRKSSVPTSDPQ